MKALIVLSLLAGQAFAQTITPPPKPPVAKSPTDLASMVMARYATGSAEEFAAVFPDAGVRALVRMSVQQGATREMTQQRVLWERDGRAVLLLGGRTRPKDSTSNTARGSRQWAGLYEVVDSPSGWSVSRELPIDSMNAIRSHAIHADVVPGKHVDIVDTIGIRIGAPYGMVVRLNPNAVLNEVRVDGRGVNRAFAPATGSGLLWFEAPVRDKSTLVLSYSVPEDRRAAGRGGPPPPSSDTSIVGFGQYFFTDAWHAYLDINSPNDRAVYSITATIPAEFHLTTSLPQTDSVVGRMRIVHGTSTHPQFLVSLIYDRYWQPKQATVGGVRIETFLRPDSRLAHDTAVGAFARVYKTLSDRFGAHNNPPYLAVVQAYGYPQPTCAQRQADLVMCGAAVADSMTRVALGGPAYAWAHETSHAWTMNADGPAATMLREGWATYAEAAALRAEMPDLEFVFWERARNAIMLSNEGKQSLIPPNPLGGFYSKGAWVFHMYEHLLGTPAFDRAMRAYIKTEADGVASGYPELIAVMSKEEGHDLTAFTMPYLSGRFLPDLEGTMVGTKLIVSQKQPESVYDLPKLDVDLVSAMKTTRRTIHVSKMVDTMDVGDVGQVTAVKFDPDHHFLMQRRWGETVRFELPVSKAPNAKTVTVAANRDQASFTLAPIPAAREGDTWVLTLPLSEGRYPYHWEIDGKTDPSFSAVRVVRSVERVGPYPR